MKLPTITPSRLPYQKLLASTTLREFSGGWNITDDELNLSYKYARKLQNCYVNSDGRIVVRDGITKWTNINGEGIINAEYFIDSLVIVTETGSVYRMFADGGFTTLSTTVWGVTDFVSFAKFNNHLIICNGIDKPLDLDTTFTLEYLQDAGTGTNINVPVCKYVVSLNRYLAMAGDPLEPNRVHISQKDAPGTWYGDPPPNDATRVDVGSIIPSATIIRGLTAFRGKLVVMFAEGLVFGTLGVYDDNGNHNPSFDDGVEGFGSVSHRAAVGYGDDVLFMDLEGVPSIKRTVLSASFKPSRLSRLIDPEITADLRALDFITMEDRIFTVHNRRDNQFMLFVPNATTIADTTETRAFVYTNHTDTSTSWSEFVGWNFTCAVRSLEGNVFFGDKDGNIWLYTGTKDYADATVSPAVAGIGINFDWELPWLDFGNRAFNKNSKYISFDTRGASEFTCEMYVDELEDVALSMRFSGGEQGLFGHGPQPYGGGRNTSRKKLYAWPAKFQIARLRFHGSSEDGLEFIGITIQYLNSSEIRR